MANPGRYGGVVTAPRTPAPKLPAPWELDPVAVGFVFAALGFLAGYVVGAL